MIDYLFYKLINEAIFFFSKKNAKSPMLSLICGAPKTLRHIHFDFDHPTTHLGDRIFFFPLIAQLHAKSFSLSINSADKITRALFHRLYGVDPFLDRSDLNIDLVVIPKPSYLNKRGVYKPLLIVDFTDPKITAPISESLVQSFGDLFDQSLPPPIFLNDSSQYGTSSSAMLADDQAYYLFSNYIHSGIFRKWFLDENRLQLKCVDIKNQGYKLIHVGSEKDKATDKKEYSYVDLDLRGKLSLVQLISLVASPQVNGSITYDNFLMHLTGLFNKKAYVLFRGRFSKSGSAHHFEHVNNTCFSKENKPHYL